MVFDLSRSGKGRVSISNKPSRVDELNETLVKIMKEKFVIPTSMPSVLGKLQYADSHVWGRAGLDESQVKAFGVLKDRLCSGRPKTFVADDIERPVLIFTDEALEYDNGEPKAKISCVCLARRIL